MKVFSCFGELWLLTLKAGIFQEDLYPMTAGNQAAMTAKEWLLGINRGHADAQPHHRFSLEIHQSMFLLDVSCRPCADVPEAWESQPLPRIPCS